MAEIARLVEAHPALLDQLSDDFKTRVQKPTLGHIDMNKPSPTESPSEQERRPNTWAIVSLMLSLIALIAMYLPGLMYNQPGYELLGIYWEDAATFLFPAAACMLTASIIIGFVARAKARKDPMLFLTWAAKYGIILSFALFVLFPMFVPASGVAREKARGVSCISNLKHIATAITMYSDDDPSGRMPASLDALVGGVYGLGTNNLRCPKHEMKFAYIGSNKVWQSNGTELGVYCTDRHLDKVNVLYLDGRVVTILPAELVQPLESSNGVQ